MRRIVLAGAAIVVLAGIADAGEGEGDPFGFHAPPTVTRLQGHSMLPGKGQDPFPFRAEDMSYSADMPTVLVAPNGAQRTVESVNSLPPGFQNGTVAYESAKIMFAYRQERARAAALAMARANIRNNAATSAATGGVPMASAK